jgi:PmbA protein
MTKLDFLYTQTQLNEIANEIIHQAQQEGASDAQVELSESITTDIEVLNQEIENFETSHENQLLLTVYMGHKKGHIGISSIKLENSREIIRQALDIAKYTEEDSANGLLEKEYIVTSLHEDLQLYAPYPINNSELIMQTKELEQIALDMEALISASDGASTALTRYNFVTANSNGLNHGYQTSRYSKSLSLIGKNAQGMQTDYWYSSSRVFTNLSTNDELAKKTVSRIKRRLNSASYTSGKPAVIFESTIAKSIIGSLIGALSGGSLYRKLSFLNDSLGQQILPDWFNMYEDPFVVNGLASCYFDNEGSTVARRTIIEAGKVQGYFLSSYTARKMNMRSTGNAGGSHNIYVTPNHRGDLESLAREMQNGLIIIETIGHGLNMVTGDYSVGASALVVINGEISHFTDNLTIAGNMRKILQQIALISDDTEFSSVNCGAMLINPGIIQVSVK